MKRIILISLFFCLTLTTVLAQQIIDINTPDSNGLSTNNYSSFGVPSSGIILNNSSSASSSQLTGGTVSGNSNITGSAASLILSQVTSTTASLLSGTIEVVGNEAGLIIANPNGIVCDGCGFINTNRVDLVTGSGYNASTNIFDSIATTDIFVGSGGLNASSVAVLNIQTEADFVNLDGATTNANNFNVTVGDDFYNQDSATINADNFNVTASGKFLNLSNSTISAEDSFTVTVGNDFFNQDGATINADNFNVTASGNFLNLSNATISAEDSFNVTAETDFVNQDSEINADNFNVTAGVLFVNQSEQGNATINVNDFNVTAGNDFINQFTSRINANDFNVTAGNRFENYVGSTINADTVTIEVPNFADDISNTGIVEAPSLNIILTDDFTHRSNSFAGFINFGNLTISTEGTFTNNTLISRTDTITITANSFTNTGRVVADTFNLSGAGDFDYANRGTITAKAFNLTVDGNFSNNDANSNFTWDDNYSLNVSGNADITTNNYNQSGAIDVAGTLTVNANNYTYNRPNDDFIWGANDSLTVAGDANITTNNFANAGNITADTLNLSLAGDFDYATDFLDTGTTTAENLNFTARNGVFTNDTTIELAGNLGITANSFTNTGGVVSADTFTLSVAGDFNYVTEFLNNGTITTDVLNLTVGGDFTNDDENNDFTWGANDNLTVSGNADIVAAGFANSGNITVTNSSLNLTATDFTNNGTISANTTLNTTVSNTSSGSFNNTGGVLNADTVSLSLAGDFDDTKKGIINANYFNLTVGGSFINNNTNSDFVLATNDSLSILGDFTIATNNYIQFGTLEVSGDLAIDAERNFFNSGAITTESLNITAGYTAINQGSIVSANLDVITADFFRNLTGGDIDVDNLNIIAGGKVTNTATITVGTLTITANNDSTRTNDTTGF